MTNIQHLKELLAQAEATPWHHKNNPYELDDKNGGNVASFNAKVDCELLTQLINAAPALLAVVEAAEKWRDASWMTYGHDQKALNDAVDALPWRKKS